VARRAKSPYEDNGQTRHWIKIKNRAYSQREGRGELFKKTNSAVRSHIQSVHATHLIAGKIDEGRETN
jgi:hypothetical protein